MHIHRQIETKHPLEKNQTENHGSRITTYLFDGVYLRTTTKRLIETHAPSNKE